MDEKLAKQLNIAIGIVFVVAAGVLVFMAVSRQEENDYSTTTSATTTAEAAAPLTTEDYDGLSKLTEVALASNFESWTPEAKVDAAKTVAKKLAVKGEFAKAYLLVKSSEGGDALTRWDSFFFKMNDTGGHLFRPLTLPVPAEAGTTLLYDLRDVPFLATVPYDENRTPDHADLLSTLRDGHVTLVTSFVSSLRQSSIDKLSIYYACKDGSSCSIAVQ